MATSRRGFLRGVLAGVAGAVVAPVKTIEAAAKVFEKTKANILIVKEEIASYIFLDYIPIFSAPFFDPTEFRADVFTRIAKRPPPDLAAFKRYWGTVDLTDGPDRWAIGRSFLSRLRRLFR